MQLQGTGKIKDVKIKPECGELNFEDLHFQTPEFKKIAQLIEDKEQLQITVETLGTEKIKIVTAGKIKECTIKPDAAKLKYDGLDFTENQYAELACIVKGGLTCEMTIEPEQGELFGEKEEEAAK